MATSVVKVHVGDTQVGLETPYHPSLPAAAKKLGGKWVAPVWVFDKRDESRVRELAIKLFGTDGSPTAVTTVRLHFNNTPMPGAELWLFGRELLRRKTRDSDVTLGDGVVLLEGTFPSRGGSAAHPDLGYLTGVIEVRDIPVTLLATTSEATKTLYGVLELGEKPKLTEDEVRLVEALKSLNSERLSLVLAAMKETK